LLPRVLLKCETFTMKPRKNLKHKLQIKNTKWTHQGLPSNIQGCARNCAIEGRVAGSTSNANRRKSKHNDEMLDASIARYSNKLSKSLEISKTNARLEALGKYSNGNFPVSSVNSIETHDYIYSCSSARIIWILQTPIFNHFIIYRVSYNLLSVHLY
jgi:vancomycin resistance protein YoaR